MLSTATSGDYGDSAEGEAVLNTRHFLGTDFQKVEQHKSWTCRGFREKSCVVVHTANRNE